MKAFRSTRSSWRRKTCGGGSRTKGLESYLKCTGGKGLHVSVPLAEKDNWEDVKAFCAGSCRGDGGGSSGRLCRDDEQGEAQRENFRRLFPERLYRDGDCRLFRAGEGGSARRRAAGVARTRRDFAPPINSPSPTFSNGSRNNGLTSARYENRQKLPG